ncbi:permease [Paracoccus sp. (in: a-proteobacteria)]|uniref:permease n=1 Tax=Paracoccus sp. TaxID=267 RepID=UPI0026E02E0B|nr:permease [Paracoccus sp. (in: a-proteobacteria)]MDO5369866.1 permease [Paracoccus sp. (in: a-proteobacteria)]
MDMSFEPGGEPLAGPFVAGGNEGELGAGEAIDVAGEMFREVAEELHRLRIGLRGGSTEDVKDTARLVRDLRVATQLVLEERNRVDKLRKEVAGDVGAGRLDLAAARDEIGRRLACLRRAGGG